MPQSQFTDQPMVKRGRGIWYHDEEAFGTMRKRHLVPWGRGIWYHEEEAFCTMRKRHLVPDGPVQPPFKLRFSK